MAQVISKTPLFAQHQVKLVLMDCFGKTQEAYVTLGVGLTPDEKAAALLSGMAATEQAIIAWAAAQAPPMDLTGALADGAAAIAAAVADAAKTQ